MILHVRFTFAFSLLTIAIMSLSIIDTIYYLKNLEFQIREFESLTQSHTATKK